MGIITFSNATKLSGHKYKLFGLHDSGNETLGIYFGLEHRENARDTGEAGTGNCSIEPEL